MSTFLLHLARKRLTADRLRRAVRTALTRRVAAAFAAAAEKLLRVPAAV